MNPPIYPVNRRAVLRSAGAAAASVALRRSLFALSAQPTEPTSTPIAKTRYGSISGTREDGINLFRGVPYGADTAPVRFQAPLPPAHWAGVRACESFTTRAPQLTALRGLDSLNSSPSLGSAGSSTAGAPPRIAPESGLQSEDCLIPSIAALFYVPLERPLLSVAFRRSLFALSSQPTDACVHACCQNALRLHQRHP